MIAKVSKKKICWIEKPPYRVTWVPLQHRGWMKRYVNFQRRFFGGKSR